MTQSPLIHLRIFLTIKALNLDCSCSSLSVLISFSKNLFLPIYVSPKNISTENYLIKSFELSCFSVHLGPIANLFDLLMNLSINSFSLRKICYLIEDSYSLFCWSPIFFQMTLILIIGSLAANYKA